MQVGRGNNQIEMDSAYWPGRALSAALFETKSGRGFPCQVKLEIPVDEVAAGIPPVASRQT